MKRWKVLVTAPRAQSVIEAYKKDLGKAGCDVVTLFPIERLEEKEVLPLVEDIDGMICGDDQITNRVMNKAPRLRVIVKWGTGIDSIDVAAAEKRGIKVCNTPGAFSDPVADTVLGYILLFTRKLDRMNTEMHAGLWQRIPLLTLGECRLGIIGLGRIGCAVAARASAFGMRILAYSIDYPDKAIIDDLGIERVTLETLLANSDFVTLHANLNNDNRHLLGMDQLRKMKPTAILINTARGALVDETALITALQEGFIAGAALDVFEEEPLPLSSPLRSIRNVYLAPHNANAGLAAADRVHADSIRNLLSVLNAES